MISKADNPEEFSKAIEKAAQNARDAYKQERQTFRSFALDPDKSKKVGDKWEIDDAKNATIDNF